MSFFKSTHKSSDADSSRSANSPFVGVQAKLNIGKSNDKYEREADAVADKVVNKDGIFGNQPFLTPSPSVQRSEDQELQKSEETEQIQEKPIAESITPLVQRKEDEEVQQKAQEEALQMKLDEELQQKEEEEVQTKEEEVQKQADEEPVQKQQDENDIQQKQSPEHDTGEALAKPKAVETSSVGDASSIQRKDDEIQEKEEEIQEKEDEEKVQRNASADTGDTSNLENNLSSSKGGGNPMDQSTRSQMESGFGADFSGVRIHNDANAVQMNKDLGAQAFANGNDIYFNEGKYDPASKDGQHLLAHELTHTIQQGASSQSNVQKAAAEPAEAPATKPTTPLDITHRLDITDAWAKYLDAENKKKAGPREVDVKIGERFYGTIELSRKSGTAKGELAKYEITSGTKKNYLKINGWNFFDPMRAHGVEPVLVLNNFGDEQITTGFLSVSINGVAPKGQAKGFLDGLNGVLDKLGFLGLSPIKVAEGFENEFSSGRLVYQIGMLQTVVDGYLEAGGGLGIMGDVFTFNVNAAVDIPGIASGELTIARGEDGSFSGSVDIQADIANVNAKLHAEYINGAVTIQGTGTIQSDKFTGEITLLVTDKERSNAMMDAALGVESMDGEKEKAESPAEPLPKTKNNQVLAGWGTVDTHITPWLQGKASVGIDSEGHVTIVGEISVPDEVELMEQRGKKVSLFDVEIRAGYGIPLVGQVFLFASIGMFMNAGFGPLVLKNIGLKGTYSTDTTKLREFEITGTLGINAFAILGLEAEAGVGLTILGHDLKAGVNVTAAAGLRAYAEATPTLEYKEQATPEGGKVGESRLKGHFEAAAQLFLQLSGSLFYELDSPWWSPAPDGREDFPFMDVQYPIGESMGVGADMDWLIGSDEAPELKFSPVEFDPDKFTSDIMADPPPGKKGKSDEEKKGEWVDGNKPGDQQENPEVKDGKGLPENSKKKEDLKNLPDEEKYMRSLDEMSKLEKADPKPTLEVAKAKAQKVKTKYGIDSITVKDKKDQAEISVKHKKENNKNNILKVPLMSAAERYKLLKKAMDDLKVRNKKAGGEEGVVAEADAQTLINDWKTAHPVVEEVRVVDGGATWDYFIDIGDKSNTEKGLTKKEQQEKVTETGDSQKEGSNESYPNLIGLNEKITADGGHKLIIGGTLKKIIIEVHSKPKSLNELINDKRIEIHKSKGIDKEYNTKQEVFNKLEIDKKNLGSHVGSYIRAVDKLYEGGPATDVTLAYNQAKIVLGQIKDGLDIIGVDIRDWNLPPTTVSWSESGGKASNVTAEPLTKIVGNTNGGKASDPGNPIGWQQLQDEGATIGGAWVRAHLLNHKLHGPGDKSWNLFPGTRDMNIRDMLNQVENPAKGLVNDGRVLYYEVNVSYGNTGNYDFIPDVVTMEYGEYDVENKKRGTTLNTKTFTQMPPTHASTPRVKDNLNSSTANDLTEIADQAGKTGMHGFFVNLAKERKNGTLVKPYSLIKKRLKDSGYYVQGSGTLDNHIEDLKHLADTLKLIKF